MCSILCLSRSLTHLDKENFDPNSGFQQPVRVSCLSDLFNIVPLATHSVDGRLVQLTPKKRIRMSSAAVKRC